MEKERMSELLDKLEDRADRWIKDAESRDDWNDVSFYEGQKKVVRELRDILSRE